MASRSRTGCLTCRKRKLKCDEQNPVCGPCHKASRECIPSTGIIFRHQQNASMNQSDAQEGPALKGFYAYKNTFDKNNVWVDVPKHVKFVVNQHPDADLDLDDPSLRDQDQDDSYSWPLSGSNTQTPSQIPQALRAFSDSGSIDNRLYRPASSLSSILPAFNAITSATEHSTLSSPSASSVHLSQSLSDLMHQGQLSPVFDPMLEKTDVGALADDDDDSDHENPLTDFLIQHYAQGPGLWMDLFDFGFYFARYVPVKAALDPLLKHAAAACSAKHLSRISGKKPVISETSILRLEQFADIQRSGWSYIAAKHYDTAVSQLVEALTEDSIPQGSNDIDHLSDEYAGTTTGKRKSMYGTVESSNPQLSMSRELRKRRRLSGLSTVTDEMAAATAILCLYELIDGASNAWARHLDGTKSLLDFGKQGMMPLQTLTTLPRQKITQARRATFWNFARQDCMSALIHERQTRLDTEDLTVWKDAGLLLDEDGMVKPSNSDHPDYSDSISNMREDMSANALVWLTGKIVNYCVAADEGPSDTPHSWLGIKQATILERWRELQKELDVWYEGLPDTFKTFTTIPADKIPKAYKNKDGPSPFPGIRYNIALCASTLQWWHLAQMTLSLNQPQQSTIAGTTFYMRLESFKTITADIEQRARAICSIALMLSNDAARIHAVQPLYFAGQSLEKPHERREVIRLMRGIQHDTGWATDYRINQLLECWGWSDTDVP